MFTFLLFFSVSLVFMFCYGSLFPLVFHRFYEFFFLAAFSICNILGDGGKNVQIMTNSKQKMMKMIEMAFDDFHTVSIAHFSTKNNNDQKVKQSRKPLP